jgi:hypothetical protein
VANPGGDFTVTTTGVPTRKRSASGAWVPLDATLARLPDGGLGVAAAKGTLRLSGGGTGPAITVGDDAGHALSLSLPVALPAPRVSGAEATYANVYPGIDLSVTAKPTGGFSEVFTVRDAAALATARALTFSVSATNLTLVSDSGGVSAVDPATGDVVLAAPPAAMWDSTSSGRTPTSGSVADAYAVNAVRSSASGPGLFAQVAPVATGVGSGALTLSADPAAFGAQPPVLPLYLDPSWSLPSASGKALHFDQTQAGCPTFKYYDNVRDMGVGYNEFSSCIGAFRSFMDLDLSTLHSNYDIKSSTMKITEDFSAYNSCGQGSETIGLYWSGGINSNTDWADQPGTLSNSTVSSPMDSQSVKSDGNASGVQCSGGVTPNFGITDDIAYFVSHGTTSLTVEMRGDESVSTSLERFNVGTEDLVTVYDIPPDTPSNLSAKPTPLLPGGAQQPCGSTSSPGWMGITNLGGKSVGTLSATLTSDLSQAQMYGKFTITDATSNTTTHTNSSGFVTTGGAATVNTPTLVNGHKYAWNVVSDDQYDSSGTSATCGFNVDLTAPLNPAVTSAAFPSLAGGGTSTVTTGQSGTLTMTSSDPVPTGGVASGLRGFEYSFDRPVPSGGGTFLAQNGGAATVTFSTSQWGVHTLYTRAEDNAGNVSGESQYSFYVPWNPATKVTNGDVSGDGIPDLVTTDSSGNLVTYLGNLSPTASAATVSTPVYSPDGTSWANYLTTHYGSYTNQGVDDLWAFQNTTNQLYLYKNAGGTSANFETTGNVTTVSKAEVFQDASTISPATGNNTLTTGCLTTSTGSCAGYNNTDWTSLTQLTAAGDLYQNSPVPALDNVTTTGYHVPGMLTVENGSLWYYQGQVTQFYLGTAIQLGTSGWDSVTVLGTGTVSGTTVLWARDKTSGTVSQYPITYDSAGYPVSLGAPTGTSGTTLTVPAGRNSTGTLLHTIPATQYPQVYTVDLHGTGNADLVATTPTGVVIDWPGTTPATGLATFGSPTAMGNIGAKSGNIGFPLGTTVYPTGSTWTNGTVTMTFNQGALTISNASDGALRATFGPGGLPTAYLVLQTDGNLVIYNDVANPTSAPWATGTNGSGAAMTLQSGGNLVITNSAGGVVWQSGT